MAYENMTYEYILQRMMDRVTIDYPNLDTREGSILFNALAPAAMELAILYTELDNAINESFVDTATREYILIACKQIGMDITIFNARAGIHKGLFDVPIEIGSRWNCDIYNYKVTDFLWMEDNNYAYMLECETLGTSPNNQTGILIPITDAPQDLTYSELVECLIEGENEATDDEIRKSYYEFINNAASDGNVAQYKKWCNEYPGIGNSKIFPLWNGANTVKVSILDVSNHAASQVLIDDFQEYLDPETEGMGNGVAPIGAFVTVSTAEEVPINMSGTVALESGSDTSMIRTALSEYFSTLSYETNLIPYVNIGAEIIKVDGVKFVTDLLVNGSTDNVELGEEQIPVVGTLNWTVAE